MSNADRQKKFRESKRENNIVTKPCYNKEVKQTQHGTPQMTNAAMTSYCKNKKFHTVADYEANTLERHFDNGEVWSYDSEQDYWTQLS